MDLEIHIENLKREIQEKQKLLAELEENLKSCKEQNELRKQYIASKEIIDYVQERSGKLINMSTIKRWTDEGYLGEVIDERAQFWALKTKQGKKRNLYNKSTVFSFLYTKGYIAPYHDILDEVQYCGDNRRLQATVISVRLEKGRFLYKLQLPDYTVLEDVDEMRLEGVEGDG
ncbi:hypothetical protein [Aneurinibacillus tyrosinisolvens]|uniref:hypothetical protein n=1 Tax=Aneurinibacillus tyrosinisolvens TaxID=1443435 RepID=UPI00069C4CC2|nr:hypothetical protein [Aneurinibacillus tyrosinisolvens]